jgi:Na+/glutamate symporter
LSSARSQVVLLVLMGLVTLALWRMPTEGLGMTLARSLVTALAAISAVWVGVRLARASRP